MKIIFETSVMKKMFMFQFVLNIWAEVLFFTLIIKLPEKWKSSTTAQK